MRAERLWNAAIVVVALAASAVNAKPAAAQDTQPAATREEAIAQEQADKAKELHPFVMGKGERVADKVEDFLINGLRWYPYIESAYAGGGFPFGVGYKRHVSSYNLLDVRGSYTFAGYKRAEAEFTAPHLFHRRGQLSILGGWRQATEVGFFGIGPDTSKSQRTSYEFDQPYVSAALSFMPTRRYWKLGGEVELTQ